MYKKDRLRRSMMFVPGNNPGMIRDAHIYGADSIMFDLEDSVAYTEKDAARRFFMDLQQTFIDWNDKKMDTPEFAQIRATLEEKIDAAKEK